MALVLLSSLENEERPDKPKNKACSEEHVCRHNMIYRNTLSPFSYAIISKCWYGLRSKIMTQVCWFCTTNLWPVWRGRWLSWSQPFLEWGNIDSCQRNLKAMGNWVERRNLNPH